MCAASPLGDPETSDGRARLKKPEADPFRLSDLRPGPSKVAPLIQTRLEPMGVRLTLWDPVNP